jgi:hypothetical protein
VQLTLLAVAALNLAPVLGLWAVAREMAQLIAVAAGHSGRIARLVQISFKAAIWEKCEHTSVHSLLLCPGCAQLRHVLHLLAIVFELGTKDFTHWGIP